MACRSRLPRVIPAQPRSFRFSISIQLCLVMSSNRRMLPRHDSVVKSVILFCFEAVGNTMHIDVYGGTTVTHVHKSLIMLSSVGADRLQLNKHDDEMRCNRSFVQHSNCVYIYTLIPSAITLYSFLFFLLPLTLCRIFPITAANR